MRIAILTRRDVSRAVLGLLLLGVATSVLAGTWTVEYNGITFSGAYSVGTCSSGGSGPLTLQPGETGTICNDSGRARCVKARVGDGP